MCIGTVNRKCLVMNLTLLACKSVVKYISRTNSDHLVISLTSPGPSSGLMSDVPDDWSAPKTRRVAHCAASLTIRRRADGPDDAWSVRSDPSFGPSTLCMT